MAAVHLLRGPILGPAGAACNEIGGEAARGLNCRGRVFSVVDCGRT